MLFFSINYFNKNSAPEELIKAIRQIQRGKRYMSEETAAKLEHLGQKKQKADLLSNRELTILKLLAEGKSTSQISDQLELAPTTVSTYRSRILENCNYILTVILLVMHFKIIL
ncbi:MAG: LuxR C-terminal-related transcriptional regulator [Chitinophagaceae bacterium]